MILELSVPLQFLFAQYFNASLLWKFLNFRSVRPILMGLEKKTRPKRNQGINILMITFLSRKYPFSEVSGKGIQIVKFQLTSPGVPLQLLRYLVSTFLKALC